jgi:hypothetical protein
MAPKKNSLVDFGMSILNSLLGTNSGESSAPKKRSIEDVPIAELKREKVRLEQEERKLLNEIRTLEAQKRSLFNEGVRKASEREQRVLARRIKEVDAQSNNYDRMLQSISKQMRVLNGFVQIKERIQMDAEWGIAGLVSNLNLEDLMTYVSEASVNGEFNMNMFDDVLAVLEKNDAISPNFQEDEDVLDIMKEMQMAREAEDQPELMEEHFERVQQKLQEKNQPKDLEDEILS